MHFRFKNFIFFFIPILFISNDFELNAQNQSYASQFVRVCGKEMKKYLENDGQLTLTIFNRCFYFFDPESLNWFRETTRSASNARDRDYIVDMNMIQHIKSISYLESEDNNNGKFTLVYTFRKDSSQIRLQFDGDNFCKNNPVKKLCAWSGNSKTFDLEYDEYNFAYNETVSVILSQIEQAFKFEELNEELRVID